MVIDEMGLRCFSKGFRCSSLMMIGALISLTLAIVSFTTYGSQRRPGLVPQNANGLSGVKSQPHNPRAIVPGSESLTLNESDFQSGQTSVTSSASTPALDTLVRQTGGGATITLSTQPSLDIDGPIGVLPAPQDGKKIILNFQDAPWQGVLKRLAEESGFALKINTLPEGTFTYLSAEPLSPVDALDLLNAYLYSNGYLIIRNKDLLTVVQLDPEVPLPLHVLPVVSPFELEMYGDNELLTIEVVLTTMDPFSAAAEVQNLLSPIGRVVPLSNSNRMIVTDFGGNLRQLYMLLWYRESDPANQPQLVYKLKNTSATDVAKAINDYLAGQSQDPLQIRGTSRTALAGGQVTPAIASAMGGQSDAVVVAEPNTNSILVSASHRYLEKIRMIIAELDCLPPQVLIQALLVEVDLGNTEEFGMELGAQSSVLFDRSLVNEIVTVTETVSNPGTGIATTNQRIISQSADPGFNFNNRPLGNNIAANPNAVGSQGLSNFALGRVNGDLGYGGLVLSAGSESISLLLRALATKYKIDILSRPQIRTLDNKEAVIQIGQQVPVVDGVSLSPVGTANPVIRQDQAGIILTVLPKASPNDELVIDVRAEKSEYRTAPGSGIPIFTDATNGNVIEAPIKDVSKVETMVSCFAGQTIVLGGMITKGTSKIERKVPILGDIPLVGWLFRYDNEQMKRKELLIILTPYVVSNPLVSDEHNRVESQRIHFPYAEAEQIHGPYPAPPPIIEPRGIHFPEWPFFRKRHDEIVTQTEMPKEQKVRQDELPLSELQEESLQGQFLDEPQPYEGPFFAPSSPR